MKGEKLLFPKATSITYICRCFSFTNRLQQIRTGNKQKEECKTEVESYVMALRVISPRNKSGIIRLVGDMMKEHPKTDIEDVIKTLYPHDRDRRRG